MKMKTFAVITGASRGLGRSICLELASKVGPDSTFVLMGRANDKLLETSGLMKHVNPGLSTFLVVADALHATFDQYEGQLKEAKGSQEYESAIIIHNAGSLGNQGTFVQDFHDLATMQDYYKVNVFAVMLLNSAFVKLFSEPNLKQKVVVNISSLAAVQPFDTWGSYCSGKAARDSLFQVFASEENGRWRVLNYAPGPLDTDMISSLLEDSCTLEKTRQMFLDMKKTGQMLTAKQSAQKLVEILQQDAFKQGQHLDYFDA